MNMRMLSVSLLLCAAMALTAAAGEHMVVKRWANCANGWSELFGNCYKIVTYRRTWADAEKVCLSQGGNLASIQSKAEYKFIQDLIHSTTSTNTHAWIGGYDATKDGVWLWSDGRPMKFTDWAAGEPNNYKGNQGCMILNWGSAHLWDDYNCDSKVASVCKQKSRAQ